MNIYINKEQTKTILTFWLQGLKLLSKLQKIACLKVKYFWMAIHNMPSRQNFTFTLP